MKRFATYDDLPDAESITRLGEPWQLYKQLVAGIPEDVRVLQARVCMHWVYVVATSGMGIAMLVRGGRKGCRISDASGMRLRDVAALCTSWRFTEASLGVAALNAWYSSEPVACANGMMFDSQCSNDGFDVYAELIVGKHVAVVGHFPLIERLADTCELTVLERDPHDGDVPDPACEYILAEQDYAFITGTALTNKTMPRLLELCSRGRVQVVLVGPSVVPSPLLFDYGVVSLAGCVCPQDDAARVQQAIDMGADMSIFASGAQRMYLESPSWKKRNRR